MTNPEVPQKMPYVMEVEPGTYYWCSCGKSSKQPFCDGSHKGTEFAPMKVTIEEKQKVAFCGCKGTGASPFCDGAHAKM
ncbi:MAG: CDGSH iron-sulfur domain-containing protein [Bacteroidota bacterium]